uniref:Glycosyltransferase n=1 Tax=Kalanchoe fedtschenkoi TaxID=63787 RepID=A0A7N0V2Q7_KALFE
MPFSNKLADTRGSTAITKSILSTTSDSSKNPALHSDLPQSIRHGRVPGLGPDIQTTADCTNMQTQQHLLATAFDRIAPFIESFLNESKPDVIFHDFSHWLPQIARKTKTLLVVAFCIVSSATIAHTLIPARAKKDLRMASFRTAEFGDGISFHERIVNNVVMNSDAIMLKTCRKLEGHYLDYIERNRNKVVLTAGPTLPELVLGIELTGLPFLIALKPPAEAESEAALPDGFSRRTEDRGMVTGGWVQQQHILAHESVGCFVTHCGSGSVTEGLVSECQLVLLPHFADQYINARVMGEDLRVGVEVEKGDEDGLFDRNGVCRAVRLVMNMEGDGVGKEVKINHDNWRKFLLTPGLERSCLDETVTKLKEMITCKFQ